ncbi:hypothetical protein RFI_30342, partial [Reticulomyxa filosa]
MKKRFLTENDYLNVYHHTSNVFNNKPIHSKEKQKDKEINVDKQVNFSASSHHNTNTNNDSHTTNHHNNSNSGEFSRRCSKSYSRQSIAIYKKKKEQNILWAEVKLSKRIKFLFVKGTFKLFLKKLIFDNQNLLLYRLSEKSHEQMNMLFLDVLSDAKITRMSQGSQANQTIPRNDIPRRRTAQ